MGCVLVVDDRRDDRELLATVIGHIGHRVLKAGKAEKALELVRSQRPDLVITDLLMPAMNGYEFVRDLRADPQVCDTPVIFCTANYIEDEVRTLAAACEVSSFLPKPCEPETIIDAVEEVLGPSRDGLFNPGPVPDGSDREQLGVLNDKLVQKVRELESSNGKLARSSIDLQRSNDDLEQFAYVVSHDLSEPIRAVSGMVQLLARHYAERLGDDADLYISRAVEASQRMQTLIHDLLEYSRVGQGELRRDPVACSVLVGQVIESLQEAIEEADANVSIERLPTLCADPTQLRQLFQNLIWNALKFRSDARPDIHVSAMRDGRAWRVSVTDNGIGIEPRYVRRIFEVFKRLHGRDAYAGSGIGLSICKRIVERHGGKIWVEPAEDGGSRFQFTIPDLEEVRV